MSSLLVNSSRAVALLVALTAMLCQPALPQAKARSGVRASGVKASTGQPGRSAFRQQVLFDFRKEAEASERGWPRFSPEEKRKILSAVFRSYLTEGEVCDAEALNGIEAPERKMELAAARKAGQIFPEIVSTARGSFTLADSTQTAYIIAVRECNSSHADNYGTKRLVIFDGERVVADVDTDDHSQIARVSDLNRDGVSELLLTGFYMQMGHSFVWAKLVELRSGRERVIKNFGTMIDDPCGSEFEGDTTVSSVIYYALAGRKTMPSFRVAKQRARCPK